MEKWQDENSRRARRTKKRLTVAAAIAAIAAAVLGLPEDVPAQVVGLLASLGL